MRVDRLARDGLVLLLLAVVWLLGARTALGAEQTIVFDLDVEPSHQPTHICVISTAGSRTGSFVYSLPLADFQDAYDTVQDSGDYSLEALPAAIAGTHEDMRDAIASLGRIRDAQACEEPYGECNPTMEGDPRTFFSGTDGRSITRPLYVVCGHNSAHVARHGPVLMLSLNFMEEDDVPITEVRLDGNIGAITLTRSSPPTVVGRVAGGHYLTGRTHVAIDNRVRIALEPLCARRTMELGKTNLDGVALGHVALRREEARTTRRVSRVFWTPWTSWTSGDGEVEETETEESFREVRRCVPNPSVGKFDIMLARPPREATHILEMHVHSAWQDVDGNRRRLGTLKTRWTGHRPPEGTQLGFTEVSFSWRPDCTFKGHRVDRSPRRTFIPQECPDVELGGSMCHSPSLEFDDTTKLCHYTCITSATLDLPVSVEFSDGDTEQWAGRLSFPGQVLRHYIPLDQRRVGLELGAGWDMDALGRERLAIRGAKVSLGGQATFIDLEDELYSSNFKRVRSRALPAARSSCPDELELELAGDRTSEVATVPIVGGIARLPPPRKMLKPVRSYYGVSLGFSSGIRANDDTLPPTPFGAGLSVGFEMGLLWQAWGSPLFMDGGLLYAGGTREYIRVADTARELRVAASLRLGATYTIGLSEPFTTRVSAPLRSGFGVGFSGGWSGLVAPFEVARQSNGAFFAPHLRLELGPVALYLRARFFERLYQIEALTGEVLRKSPAIYVAGDLQYRFNPNLMGARRKIRREQRRR